MSVRGRISRPDLAIGVAMVVASWFEVWREEITPAWLAVAGFLVLGASVTIRRAWPLAALVFGLGSQLVAVSFGVSLETAVTPLLFFVADRQPELEQQYAGSDQHPLEIRA